MTCSCTSTLTKSFWIIHDNGCFFVTEPKSGGQVVTACSGDLYIDIGARDCALLTFTYQPSNGPAILPMEIAGNGPCEVSGDSGPPPATYTGRFKPPVGGVSTYWWTLYISQPTCRIRIIVSKS